MDDQQVPEIAADRYAVAAFPGYLLLITGREYTLPASPPAVSANSLLAAAK